ncbi:MAG: hypothetical protein IPM96_20260 [Ignavibacteria bacterium]|nr:hypothetical protein [Ignavibacteria bacterium]
MINAKNLEDSLIEELDLKSSEKQLTLALPKKDIQDEDSEISLMEENNVYFPNKSNDLDKLFSA